MVTPEILVNKNRSKHGEFVNEKTKTEDFEVGNLNILNNKFENDTVFLTLPPFNMHENTSDDLIPVSHLLDPSNGDSFTKAPLSAASPRNCLGYNSCDEASSSSQLMSSSILLESKPSQHQISIPSNLEFNKMRESTGIIMGRENTLTKENKQEQGQHLLSSFIYSEDGITITEDPSSMIVQSIFSDIFQDIENLKDAISSYMSSFYVQEEEYDNFTAFHKASREVASHVFEQIHRPLRDKKNNDLNNDQSPFIHSIVENSCLLEQSSKEDVGNKVHNKPQDIQENAIRNPTKNNAEKETSCCYCYWDDSELENDKLSQKTVDRNIYESNTQAALVPQAFIEDMWQEFTTRVETHALFLDLVDENEVKKSYSRERNFPSYGHWRNIYDPSIFEEAENIVHTIDSLFMNGCFPEDEHNNAAAYIPCTIVELLDGRESTYGSVERPDENENKPDKDKKVLTKKENENEVNGNENGNFTMCRPAVNEIHRIKIQEIKLEPVFDQEKVTIHEIDYSRGPEYEKINLNPIIHQGRVSFSSLHSESSTAAVEAMKLSKEQINEQVILSENISPNNDKENNTTVFLRANSKYQLTSEKSINVLDKNGSNSGFSMFERIPEINSPENLNPAFLFSSPTVQINLTNTFINSDRK